MQRCHARGRRTPEGRGNGDCAWPVAALDGAVTVVGQGVLDGGPHRSNDGPRVETAPAGTVVPVHEALLLPTFQPVPEDARHPERRRTEQAQRLRLFESRGTRAIGSGNGCPEVRAGRSPHPWPPATTTAAGPPSPPTNRNHARADSNTDQSTIANLLSVRDGPRRGSRRHDGVRRGCTGAGQLDQARTRLQRGRGCR